MSIAWGIFVCLVAVLFGVLTFWFLWLIRGPDSISPKQERLWLRDTAGYWWGPLETGGYARAGHAEHLEVRSREEITDLIGVAEVAQPEDVRVDSEAVWVPERDVPEPASMARPYVSEVEDDGRSSATA